MLPPVCLFFPNGSDFLLALFFIPTPVLPYTTHTHQPFLAKHKPFHPMPRMINDPTWAVCLSFEDADWDFLRQPLIDAHIGDAPLMVEEVMQQMKEAWVHENDCKCYITVGTLTQRGLCSAKQ